MKKPIVISAPPPPSKATPCPDVLLVCYCVVAGENDELLGFDETPITDIYWSAVDVAQNEVREIFAAQFVGQLAISKTACCEP